MVLERPRKCRAERRSRFRPPRSFEGETPAGGPTLRSAVPPLPCGPAPRLVALYSQVCSAPSALAPGPGPSACGRQEPQGQVADRGRSGRRGGFGRRRGRARRSDGRFRPRSRLSRGAVRR